MVDQREMVHDGENNIETPENVKMLENDSKLEDKLTAKAAVMQITMAVLSNFSIISSGMGIGYPAITLTLLTTKTNDNVVLNDTQASWFASVTAITCPIGGLLSGYLIDKIGRKNTLIAINVISIFSWTLIGLSSRTDVDIQFWQLMVARIVIGIAIGMSSSPASVYSAEIAHQTLRGRLTLLTAFCTALGMLFIYLLGYWIPTDWRMVSWISGAFTVLCLVLLFPVAESPSYLVGKNKIEAARRSIRIIRGYTDLNDPRCDREIDLLRKNSSKRNEQGVKETIWQQLKRPELYKPLRIMIAFFGFQQFSGIFVIFVYAAKVSVEAGVPIDPFLCTVFIGLTRVVTTILMAFISDTFGRKPPAFFSGFGMAFSMFSLAVLAVYPLKGTSFDWIPVFLLIFFIFSSTLGFLTLPFSMIAEMYPQRSRGLAAGLTIFAGYFMSFINIKIYPTLIASFGNAAIFTFYGVISILGIFFVHFCLLETKGKSLIEIENYFRGESKNTNNESNKNIELKTLN